MTPQPLAHARAVLRRRRVASIFTVVAILVLLQDRASADFSGPYAVPSQTYPLNTSPQTIPVGTWTLTTSGTDTFTYGNAYAYTSPTEVGFNTGVTAEEGFRPSLSIALTNTIAAYGMLSFDYSLTLHETGFNQVLNYGAYTLSGTVFQLQPGTGSVDIPVTAGDSFGFLAYASSKCITCNPSFAGGTTLVIDNFSAPVPEPATITLLLCGAGLALVGARTRLRRERKRKNNCGSCDRTTQKVLMKAFDRRLASQRSCKPCASS